MSSKIKAEPRIKDPNPRQTAKNWAYIVANEKRKKAKEAKA